LWTYNNYSSTISNRVPYGNVVFRVKLILPNKTESTTPAAHSYAGLLVNSPVNALNPNKMTGNIGLAKL